MTRYAWSNLCLGSRPPQNGGFIGRRQEPQTTTEAPQTAPQVTQPTPQPTAQPAVQATTQPQQQVQPIEAPQPVTVQSPTQPKQPAPLSPSNAKQPSANLVAQPRSAPGRASTTQRPQLTAPVTAPVNNQLPKLSYTVSPPAKLARDSVYATIKRRNRRSLYVSIGQYYLMACQLTNVAEWWDGSTSCICWELEAEWQAFCRRSV